MDLSQAADDIHRMWDDSITEELKQYISIPAKSPHFDANWADNGYIDQAIEHVARWCRAQPIEGMTVEVVRLDGRTPLIFIEIEGQVDDTVLMYGHVDKQPEVTGWDSNKGPWQPVIENDKLYGRGSADDGYAAYASLAAIAAVQAQGLEHARFVLLIESCEESGSYDLPAYIEHLNHRIGTPSLVVCLDSGAGNYEQLWITTSLRGMAAGTLNVKILEEGVHSGYASGIVPSSFLIARQLLSRIDDPRTGQVVLDSLYADIPQQRQDQLKAVADVLGDEITEAYPWVDGAQAIGDSAYERLLARNWKPALSVTGAGGLPSIEEAGNVLRTDTALKLSVRLPPTLDGEQATADLKAVLEADPPFNAKVTFEADQSASGWNAPAVPDWLDHACQSSSQAVYGRPAMYMGEGGSIPLMALLGESFPEAQFLITGVLGPHSNAHGPNEFLHLPFVKKLTVCVAKVLADHAQRNALDQAA
ncbi:MAG: M20 family metallopeptidase [Pseudomonadota bacterium]